MLAYDRASRPKPAKLVTNQVLRERVQAELTKRYSPEQIAGRLREDYPDQPEMWVSTETIYQSLYVQSRGALRRELTRSLRTGRAMRIPNRQGARRKNRVLPDMVNISERPAEALDRAVPGHWEGDLIIGKANASAIGTLVERSTGYTLLVPLHRRIQGRAGRPRPGREDPDPARPAATDADLGPGRGDARLETSPDPPPTSPSTSATPSHPGSERPTRTPTACCASTSRKAPTCRYTPKPTSTTSPLSSTTDPANAYNSRSRSR